MLEPSKVYMPSYVAVNKNANEDGEVLSQLSGPLLRCPSVCLSMLCSLIAVNVVYMHM